jgi:thiamine-phosphate pyrophosphorylase
MPVRPPPDGDRAAPPPAAGRLAGRRLYLCTPARPDLVRFLEECLRGGVDLVQLRDKQLDARQLMPHAKAAVRVCHDHGVPFILNDRPDLAVGCGADGVHVGQDDIPPALARRILGEQALIGLSTHAPAELDAAAAEPVDYLSAGPVEPTPTKPGRPGTGLGYLRYAASHASRPWFVTGGVTPVTVEAMAGAGARRFVVVRYLTEADDCHDRARALRLAIDEALAAAEARAD